jgi:hypothetical protein
VTAQLVAGHVEGCRAWRLVRHRGEPALRSLELPFLWPAGTTMRAWCPRGCTSPTIEHTCGLWLFRHYDDALELARRYSAGYPSWLLVVGRVAGAGYVVEHEDGWRVERAAVLELGDFITGRVSASDIAGYDSVAELVARAAVLHGVSFANA